MDKILLLDTSIIYDLIGLIVPLNNYINYDNILKNQKCISTFSLFEFINNKNKFNKNEIEFKQNFKKVKQITTLFITNINMEIDNNILANLENLSYKGIDYVGKKLFHQIILIYTSFYAAVILAMITLQYKMISLRGAINKPLSKNKFKKTQFRMQKFANWYFNYIEPKVTSNNFTGKNQIHNFFKKEITKTITESTNLFKKHMKYNAIGYKYGKRFLKRLKKNMLSEVNVANDNFDFMNIICNDVSSYSAEIGQPLKTEQIINYILNQLTNTIRFKWGKEIKTNKNDIIYKYLRDWIEHEFINNKTIGLENDMIDCLIASLGASNDLMPISSDKRFIENCCDSPEYSEFIYFDKLKENKQ